LPLARPIPVRAGECRFEVRAKGYVEVVRTVAVQPRALVRETVQLSAIAEARTLTAAPLVEAVTPRTERGELATRAASHPVRDPPAVVEQPAPSQAAAAGEQKTSYRTWGIVAGGVGLAAIVTGVVFGVQARSAGEKNSRPGATFDADLEARGKLFQTLQYVGYGVGLALVAGGVIGYVMGGTADHQAGILGGQTGMSIGFAGDGRGAVGLVSGSF
jgi:hypothetical protein